MNNHKTTPANETVQVEADGLENSLIAMEMACAALPKEQQRAMRFLLMTARDHATHLRLAAMQSASKKEGAAK